MAVALDPTAAALTGASAPVGFSTDAPPAEPGGPRWCYRGAATPTGSPGVKVTGILTTP